MNILDPIHQRVHIEYDGRTYCRVKTNLAAAARSLSISAQSEAGSYSL